SLTARAGAAGRARARSLAAKVTAVRAPPPFQYIGIEPMVVMMTEPEYEKAQAARAEKTLERVKSTAAAIGVPVETLRTIDSRPYEAIIAVAKERGCDLIFMASHGRTGMAG